MAGKQQSVQQDENVAAVLADMPVTPSTSATSPPFRTCSKCQRLFKNTGNTSLHSTLAYSRCRCHRYFKLSLQRHQFGLSHARQLGTQDTFSNGGASATHQSLGGNKISLDYKEHSETIAAIHSNSDKAVVQHTTLPPITHHQKSVVSFSSASCRPTNKQSKKDLLHRTSLCNSSPEASTSRLPALGCTPSLVSHHVGHVPQTDCTTVPSTSLQSSVLQQTTYTQSAGRKVRELVDIIWCIPHSTQQKLKTKFKILDKNGDGHLTFDEFLCGLPQSSERTISSNLENTLKALYLEVSDRTYFGFREFIVCFCLAEVLLEFNLFTAINPWHWAIYNYDITMRDVHDMVPQPRVMKVHTTATDRNYWEKILTPYTRCLSEFATDGMVSARNIRDATTKFTDIQSCYRVSPLASKVSEVIGTDSAPLLHCVAMAPHYLSISMK